MRDLHEEPRVAVGQVMKHHDVIDSTDASRVRHRPVTEFAYPSERGIAILFGSLLLNV